MKKIKIDVTAKNVLFRIIACAGVLFIGIGGMTLLASMKKPPTEAKPEELVLKVDALEAGLENVTVVISGYGEVQPLNSVSISPEVAGRVVSIHPRLEPGEVINQGELLFGVDSSNYQAAHDEAAANMAQLKSTIKRLTTRFQTDRDRLKTIKRSRDLARAEFDRSKKLFTEHHVGTRSGVDTMERSYNGAADQADQMEQAVTIYPFQIQEAESALAAARARLALTKINLDRCSVIAPFDGRVKMVAVESGQYVSPGQPVLTLADDSILEILVPLDSRDARKWLTFEDADSSETGAWFSHLKDEQVSIRWTEERDDHSWTGILHRVVAFDPRTRSLTVAIRIPSASAVSGNSSDNSGLPLVEGMFCQVEIPGRILSDVIRVPRWAVSFKDTVYISKDSRLKTVPVTVAHKTGDDIFISEGLAPTDIVITTRLVDPLEHTLLKVTLAGEEG
ncbi:MAG: HlyD family efflux transporter periplasmic adaptor subunit [Desulfobacteraceae bacterium]|jgi:RND family efflux transporter MFP subunit|nr:HlyD family efflux transporter periplasmic adaptor subunit [Desulfobacteraceae bacterium]